MKVKNVSLIALTVWAVAGSYLALLLMGVATFTNRWIRTTETIDKDFPNGTLRTIITMQSGLLTFCRDNVRYKWISRIPDNGGNVSQSALKELNPDPDDVECGNIRDTLPEGDEPPKSITSAVLAHVLKVLPLSICSLLLLLLTSLFSSMGLFFPQRRCFIFFTGAAHILAGLCSLSGLIRYIIAVNDAVIEKHPVSSEDLFSHRYGFSFVVAVLAFFLINSTGVASLYLYIRLEKMAVHSEQERIQHQLMTMTTCVSHAPDIEVHDDDNREHSPLRPSMAGSDYRVHHPNSHSDIIQATSIEL
ncbi:uncharacterized protein [Diadema setosum]|uniref:uncharacterized protein n=1 Tax=Diadema setosum TaxID=31175 RepID=UPI003B3B0B19